MFCNIGCCYSYNFLIVACCANYLQLVSAAFDPSTSVNIKISLFLGRALCNPPTAFGGWKTSPFVHNFVRFMSMHSSFHTSSLQFWHISSHPSISLRILWRHSFFSSLRWQEAYIMHYCINCIITSGKWIHVGVQYRTSEATVLFIYIKHIEWYV